MTVAGCYYGQDIMTVEGWSGHYVSSKMLLWSGHIMVAVEGHCYNSIRRGSPKCYDGR